MPRAVTSLQPAGEPRPWAAGAGTGDAVRDGLRREMAGAEAQGMPGLSLDGQLIRPRVAYAAALAGGRRELPEGFWAAALAVQLAHEASLVHDDIVDAAPSRRGRPTVVAARGVGAALVLGDHLLTSAYRMAARTGSLPFAALFAEAVERTVAGERAQGEAIGELLDMERYRAIALGKAGELMGCALAVGPVLAGWPRAAEVYHLGRRLGLVYQMLDDLLDYCPAAHTGKPALGDYAQRRWTWPLAELEDVVGFDRSPEEVAAALRAAGPEGSALRRCLARLEEEVRMLAADLERELGPSPELSALVTGWGERARGAVAAEESGQRRADPAPAPPAPAPPPPAVGLALRSRLPASAEVMGYLARHSRSFRFAARLFPPAEAERVGRVYAYCRVTDDLVDRPEGADSAALLDEWEALSRRAYAGQSTGIDFVDRVMGEMATARVPFTYAEELVEGMRMDLRGQRYASLPELRRYTYRVASVVGLWLTELFEVNDPTLLDRAARLGHAMQLTNILRDVGEDARRGRVYLPLDHLARYGLDEAGLGAMVSGARPVSSGYRALIEELLQLAEADYRLAMAAIPALPPAFGRPVAVAAYVYRGIHLEIRRRGYDNLRQRAFTSSGAKLVLAARALWTLRASSGSRAVPAPVTPRASA